jgi:hypothetical protein
LSGRLLLEMVWCQSACSRATSHPCTPHQPLPYLERTRTPRCRNTPRSEASVVATVHLRLMTRTSGLGRCHAASPHSLAGEPPCAIGCRPLHVAHRLHTHVVATMANEGSPKPHWSTTSLEKHPLPFLARTRATPQSAAARH